MMWMCFLLVFPGSLCLLPQSDIIQKLGSVTQIVQAQNQSRIGSDHLDQQSKHGSFCPKLIQCQKF